MVFPILKMNNLHHNVTSRDIENFERLFRLAIGIGAYSFCTAFHDASFGKNSRFHHLTKPR
jgi:hypothetical protein